MIWCTAVAVVVKFCMFPFKKNWLLIEIRLHGHSRSMPLTSSRKDNSKVSKTFI